MAVAGVVFDAFGTLVERRIAANPYRQLLREGMRQGRAVQPADFRTVMTLDCDLTAMAARLGIDLSARSLAEIQALLDADIAGVHPFSDAVEGVDLLQQNGIAVAICSNLAMPYGSVVSSLFPGLDAYAYSFRLGTLKPDPVIYQWVCQSLGVASGGRLADEAREVHMIGDSQRCDREGPRAAGLQGHFLHRRGAGDFSNLFQFALKIVEINSHVC